MAKDEIRLQYSGFIVFAAKMLSVATGLVFNLIVARTLSTAIPTDNLYGIWNNILDITSYFTLLAGVLPFWTLRFVARRKEGAIKTGIIANLTISTVAVLIYLPLISLIVSGLGISGSYLPAYLLVALQIVELYSITVLESCLQGKMPHTVAYGLVIQQAIKVALVYVLIVQFNLLLVGAVAVVIVAFAVQLVYYFKLLWNEFKQRVRWEYVKEWLKGSLANIYNVVGNQIAAYIFILLIVYAGPEARANLGAGQVVVNVITYSSFLAYALLPKLIADRRGEDITASLKMVLMFAIPLAVGGISLADSYLTMLDVRYSNASSMLRVLAADAFVSTISGFFTTVLYGLETVDQTSTISLKKLTKSRLFMAFSLPYFHSLISIPSAFYILSTYARSQPLLAALSVASINLVARTSMFAVLYVIIRKATKIVIPWKNIGKYAFAAAVMGLTLYLIPHPTRISITLIETLLGGALYLGILFVLDREARRLPGDIIQELRNRRKRVG